MNATASPSPPHIAIVGGGIAGIAAAITLVNQGVRVTLFESRRRLGGRASSYTDATTGETIDNCQHITLACCTNYLSLLDQLGVARDLTWDPNQYWLESQANSGASPTVRESVIAPAKLPAPAQYALSFLRASFLSTIDKLAIASAMARIGLTDPAAHAGRCFGELLAQWDQTTAAIARFWEPVIVSACNLALDRVHAPLALKVFQDGFLSNARAGVMGVPNVPLVRLYDAAEKILTATPHASTLALGQAVARITPTSVTLTDTTRHHFDHVICAVPPERVHAVVDPAFHDDRINALQSMQHSPILGVHLRFDRPVIHRLHHVLIEAGPQWVFRKDDAGHVLHVVISAADAWTELEHDDIIARIVADLARFLPEATMPHLLHARAVKERKATFAGTPEFDSQRPTAALTTFNHRAPASILLAGDYVQTDWPATMESATRAGRSAAAAALGFPSDRFFAPELPRSPLASLAKRLARSDDAVPFQPPPAPPQHTPITPPTSAPRSRISRDPISTIGTN
jgi:squalene-associated FAD-dependent desaturase